jgi:hypothetical protein
MSMSITDELRKLADLHKEGQLTDQEFTAAKTRLLAESPSGTPVPARTDEAAPGPAVSAEEKTYASSRWSAGNFLFPDTLTLAGDGMLYRKRRMFGSHEERISYRAVASVRVSSGVFLADLCIETSGGSQPILLHGLWKSEAREIQATIRASHGAT